MGLATHRQEQGREVLVGLRPVRIVHLAREVQEGVHSLYLQEEMDQLILDQGEKVVLAEAVERYVVVAEEEDTVEAVEVKAPPVEPEAVEAVHLIQEQIKIT